MVRRRAEQWPLQLSRFLRERNTVPFEYGVNDCLIFVADVVKLLTGFDPAEDLRGTYSTLQEADEIVKANGGMSEFMSSRLGVPGTRNLLTASRGDAALLKTPYGLMAGVVDDGGQGVAVPVSNHLTLVRFPLEKAWRIWKY